MSELSLDTVVGLTEQLLAIPSVIGDEAAIADFVEQRLRASGAAMVTRASNSLCFAHRQPEPGRKTVMLVGHLDTVPELEANPVRRDGDRLYGLGASDMKAADAVLLHVLEHARDRASRYDLVGVLYACEEGSYASSEMPLVYEAARDVFARADLAICMEPTDNRIELGCLGTSHVRVTFEGKRAHSARPWQGDNAIHKGAGLLARLAALEPKRYTYHDLEFVEVASATMVEFRGARNVIPDRFVVNVNYRFAPGKTEDDVRRDIDALIAGEASWELIDFCPAGRVCADNPLVTELIAAADAEVCAKQAWTDVGRLSHLGLDAINWGPGAVGQAHQAGEWVSIAAIEQSLAALERWLFA